MAPKKAPEMISGMKTPDHLPQRPDEATAAADDLARTLPPPPERVAHQAKPGFVRFASNVRELRVTRKITRSRTMTDGEEIPGEHFYAQFHDGVFETDDKLMIEFLKKRPNYGPGGDFWDVDEVLAAAFETAKDTWLERVKSNPELREQLRVLVNDAEDFKLEGPPPAP